MSPLVNSLRGKGGTLPPGIAADYQSDPFNALAQQAIKTGTSNAPVSSPLSGLARALQAIVGAKIAKDTESKYQGKANDYRTSLAAAIANANGDSSKFSNSLSGSDSPYLQDLGTELSIKNLSKGVSPYQEMVMEERKNKQLDDKVTKYSKTIAPTLCLFFLYFASAFCSPMYIICLF
jgi:hypothetical protein